MNRYLQKFNIFLLVITLSGTQVFFGMRNTSEICLNFLQDVDKELSIEIPNSHKNQEYPCPITTENIKYGITIFHSLLLKWYSQSSENIFLGGLEEAFKENIKPVQLSWNQILNKLSYTKKNQEIKNLTEQIKPFGTFIVLSSYDQIKNILYKEENEIRTFQTNFSKSAKKEQLNKEYLTNIYKKLIGNKFKELSKDINFENSPELEKTFSEIDNLFSIEINLQDNSKKLNKNEGHFTRNIIVVVFFGIAFAFGFNKYLNRKKSA